jgi:hypothetical protein
MGDAAVIVEIEDYTGPVWVDDDDWREEALPRRPWVAPGYAMRGAVTIVTGAPSAMKSSLMVAWGCAIALGQPHGPFRPVEHGSALIYNVEDDRTEQRRRLSAVLRQFDAVPADIRGKVIRVGPAGIGTLFLRGTKPDVDEIAPTTAMERLRELIRDRRPSVLIVDPLAELHTAEENDNTALRGIVAAFRAIAIEFDLAVIIVHHTRKGTLAPGDPDSARGASSIIGAGRVVLTLTAMSDEDADLLGVAKDRKARSAYVRLDDAKQNYSGIGDPVWFEKVLYTLDNGETVAAAVPWNPPDLWQSIPSAVANSILDEIEIGLDGGKHRYSDAPAATDRAAWKVVSSHVPSLSEAQARKVIKTWRENEVLRQGEYQDSDEYKSRKGLFVNHANRPGARG